jgi:hypothetical protein
MTTYVYACTSKKCRSLRDGVRTTMSPSATRLATGRPVTCACGRVMRLDRVESPPVRAPVDETPCPACGCPLDMHRYEDGAPRDCACCGCGWLLAHDEGVEVNGTGVAR